MNRKKPFPVKVFVLIGLLAATLNSCDRPECKNTNPIFDKFSPESKEYKAELIRELQANGAGKTRFWIDQYIERDGKTYMSIFVQGGNLCAKGVLDITDTLSGGFRIRHYKEVKGGGFSGAELDGLLYTIDSANGNYNFILKDVSHIID